VTEADTEDIVLIDKRRNRSKRLKRPEQLGEVFQALGSTVNPILTQIAKTRKVVFVEGDDFQLISRFARRLDFNRVANRSDFAVVKADGFNPERVKNLKAGMEETLGVSVAAALILDRDYRSKSECDSVVEQSKTFCRLVLIHERKEIENFLLVPAAIDRVLAGKLAMRHRDGSGPIEPIEFARESLERFAKQQRAYVFSQRMAAAKRFDREKKLGTSEETLNEREFNDIEELWTSGSGKLYLVGGKEAFSFVSKEIQEQFGVTITQASVIEAMHLSEVPEEMRNLISQIDDFSRANIFDDS
jgi:hypothetical protein